MIPGSQEVDNDEDDDDALSGDDGDEGEDEGKESPSYRPPISSKAQNLNLNFM